MNLWGVVFVVLLVMKLAGIGTVATLPWLWVAAPLWLPLAITLTLFLLCLALILVFKGRQGAIDAIDKALKK
jgi:hypothetical protein